MKTENYMENNENRLPIFNWSELQSNPTEVKRIFERNKNSLEGDLPKARAIFDEVEKGGNQAIVDIALRFDKKLSPETYNCENLRVSSEDIAKAYEKAGTDGLKNIKEYNNGVKMIGDKLMEKEKEVVTIERTPGFSASYIKVPFDSVGVYCPAGQVPLPIVSGMLVQSAACAGVKRIAVFYPPTELDAEIIVAGCEAGKNSGVDVEFYRIGGAQAMAAMTFGTETIKPVQMVVGPGSTITQAGKMIAKEKGLTSDSIGGPSEQVVLIEDGASLKAIIMAARDILTECEHGETSTGLVVTNSEKIAAQIKDILLRFVAIEDRGEVISEAFSRASAIIVAKTPQEMVEIAGKYAGEHIGLYMKDPKQYLEAVKSPSVSLNDVITGEVYASTARANYGGTYHATLPTGVKGINQRGSTTPGIFLREIEVMTIKNESATEGLNVCAYLAKCELLPSHRNAMAVTSMLSGVPVEGLEENLVLKNVLEGILKDYR